MALWEQQVYIGHLHNMYSAGQINIVQLAQGVVNRLKQTTYYAIGEPDFMDIIMELNAIDAYAGYEDYRIALDYLFDFGDEQNRLWIETESPTPKDEVIEDQNIMKIKKIKMLDDYTSPNQVDIDISSRNIITAPTNEFKGPYYQNNNTRLPIVSGNSGNSTKYNRKKSVRFLSDYEFEKRVKAKGINPKVFERDFATYVRDVDDDFQDWILDRVVENLEGYVEMKPEVASTNG